MPNVFNQLLAGLSGGFQGYDAEKTRNEEKARRTQNDLYLNEDRASQRALRDAQASSTKARADQEAFLRTPEFQSLYQQARSGDEGALAKVASAVAGHPDATTYLNSLTREPKEAKPPSTIPGTPEWRQAEIDKAKIGSQFGYHPPPGFTPVTVGGDAPDAPPVVKPFNNRTGQVGAPVGNAKPTTTRIESATNTAAKARLEAAVSEMNNAHSGMAEYEQKLRNKTANINGLQQFAGRAAAAFTHDDPISMAAQSAALAALNAQNPELARYVRRGLSFAEGESMISQRPSDFRTKMSAFLSAAATGASPEMIDDIQSRRNSIIMPLNANVKSPSGHQGATGSITPQERQALKAQGFTDAQITARYGP